MANLVPQDSHLFDDGRFRLVKHLCRDICILADQNLSAVIVELQSLSRGQRILHDFSDLSSIFSRVRQAEKIVRPSSKYHSSIVHMEA